MKAFLAGAGVALVLAVIGALILNGAVQRPVERAFTTESARPS